MKKSMAQTPNAVVHGTDGKRPSVVQSKQGAD
jgi:hypothetical protein